VKENLAGQILLLEVALKLVALKKQNKDIFNCELSEGTH
jgi:hypothetical protein